MSALTLNQVQLTEEFLAEQHTQLDLVISSHTQQELTEHLYRDLSQEELAVALAKQIWFSKHLRDALGYATGFIIGLGVVALIIN
ncbi:hypothetical protein [Aeromonas veronii]|uniref:hypothetical protein n=1 Tax=Aeromonas veronii TaxID=654 RepID=UPI003D25DFBA